MKNIQSDPQRRTSQVPGVPPRPVRALQRSATRPASHPAPRSGARASRPAAAPPYRAYPGGVAPQRRRARPRKFSLNGMGLLLWAGAALLALVLIPVILILGGYSYYQVSGRILPGVYVGDSRLSGMSVSEAAIELHMVWNMQRQMTLTSEVQTLQTAPGVLGLNVDAWQTANSAYQVGHGQPVLVELDQMFYSLENGWGIAPLVTFDPQAARLGLQALSGQISKPARDASLRLEGTRLIAVPGEAGYTIDIEETLNRLAAAPAETLLAGSLPLTLRPVPPRIQDVSAAMAAAQRLLDTPVALQAYDAVRDERLELPVLPEAVAGWLKIEAGEAGPQVSLDPGKVAATLDEISQGLGPERYLNASRYAQPLAEAVQQGASLQVLLNHHPTTYIVQPGDTLLKIGWNVGMPFWMIQAANPGLDGDAIRAGQEITIPSKDDLLPLPVVPGKRIVISISEQRLWAYQDGELLSRHVISTGIDRSPTQPGVFQVRTHETNAYASVWDLHMPDFLGIYEAWPGFMNGIHGLPTLSNGRRLWANILGRPASYGCIILDLEAAEWLYNWAEDGVVVVIEA